MKILEKTLILLLIIGIGFQLAIVSGGTLFIGVAFTSLACLYFYLGFLLFNGLRLRNVFKRKTYSETTILDIVTSIIAGIPLSICLVGIMFYIMVLPGSMIMLQVGVWSLSFLTIALLILFFVKKVASLKRILIRAIPLLFLTFWISSLDKYDWIEYQYSEYPNYIEAYKNAIEAENMGQQEAERMYEILEQERIRMEEERGKN